MSSSPPQTQAYATEEAQIQDVLRHEEDNVRQIKREIPRPYPAPQSVQPNFQLFGILPTELQIKIWEFAAHHTRWIEIEGGNGVSHADLDDQRSSQPLVLVSKPSRQPPQILSACAQSRLIGQAHYIKTIFDLYRPIWNDTYGARIYFNPDCDVVLIGERAGFSALQNLLSLNLPIKRFAKFTEKKKFGRDEAYSVPIGGRAHLHYRGNISYNDVEALRLIHNAPDTAIEEFFFLTKPYLFEVDIGSIDRDVEFKIDTSKNYRNKTARDAAKLISNGNDPGEFQNWVGEAGPKFQFGTLTLASWSGRMEIATVLNVQSFGEHTLIEASTKCFGQRNGCVAKLDPAYRHYGSNGNSHDYVGYQVYPDRNREDYILRVLGPRDEGMRVLASLKREYPKFFQ